MLSVYREFPHDNTSVNPYLVFTNILTSGHRELSSIDISIQSHTLGRTETIITVTSERAHAWVSDVLKVDSYLGSVGTGKAELNNEDGF